jgi:hypothetical protein
LPGIHAGLQPSQKDESDFGPDGNPNSIQQGHKAL